MSNKDRPQTRPIKIVEPGPYKGQAEKGGVNPSTTIPRPDVKPTPLGPKKVQ